MSQKHGCVRTWAPWLALFLLPAAFPAVASSLPGAANGSAVAIGIGLLTIGFAVSAAAMCGWLRRN